MPWKKILKNLNPYNDILLWWYDENIRWFLFWYYFPHQLIGQSDEVSRWARSVSLNGVKMYNICNPNKV